MPWGGSWRVQAPSLCTLPRWNGSYFCFPAHDQIGQGGQHGRTVRIKKPSYEETPRWCGMELPREAMALVLQKRHTEFKQLAHRLNMGTPSTKDVLENTFAHLHKMSALNSTNQKFSDHTKYLYTILSPYCETGGCPQILPSKEDMESMAAPQGFAMRQRASRKLFSPQMSLFQIQKLYRNQAGVPNQSQFPDVSMGFFNLFWGFNPQSTVKNKQTPISVCVLTCRTCRLPVDSHWLEWWISAINMKILRYVLHFSDPLIMRISGHNVPFLMVPSIGETKASPPWNQT